RDAMPQGGTLTIETANAATLPESLRLNPEAMTGNYVRLTVSDTGLGMDEEIRTHIFEPFFTTKEPGKGTGLGLATCYGIVKQSAGAIDVHSEPGQGTAFTIYIPRALETTSPSQAREIAHQPKSGTETILLVEDETFVRDIAAQALRKQGYQTLLA